jgi:hypothetical protein
MEFKVCSGHGCSICDEPGPTNEERAAAALEALSGAKYQGDRAVTDPEDISDLVADLLHLARSLGIEPDYIIHTAQMNYQAEIEEAAGIDEDNVTEDTENIFVVHPHEVEGEK